MFVRDLAASLGLSFEGNGSADVRTAAPVESAGPSELAFATGAKGLAAARTSSAGCLIVPKSWSPLSGQTIIRADQPRAAFAAALVLLYPPADIVPGCHESAAVDPTANIHPGAQIGPYVTVEAGASIGRAFVGHGCYVGNGAEIGDGTRLHSHVSLHQGVTVGKRCVLHSGCVIGADGFGFVLDDGGYRKFPQVGTVRIEDDVEIGANSCVDRAALGVTRIGRGTKLDNLVHIAHNCDIGMHVVIAAQTGLSGGVTVGDYAVIGGQVGIGDKARIESHAVLGSGCGVLTSKVVRPGEPVWGTPARPLRQHLRQLAELNRVGELREEIKALRQRLDDLAGRS
ncbi:MAG TPA: UDP-3-O-(3-hydroxymyristoyl)glucosamine N-acyltransferase [Bryobacteraceae bacterium]|nr:UDP-3-O-(3-hydroxymyristoyl)glucosamine N-acyltransferase [Bryobacteraceae bacterium]